MGRAEKVKGSSSRCNLTQADACVRQMPSSARIESFCCRGKTTSSVQMKQIDVSIRTRQVSRLFPTHRLASLPPSAHQSRVRATAWKNVAAQEHVHGGCKRARQNPNVARQARLPSKNMRLLTAMKVNKPAPGLLKR